MKKIAGMMACLALTSVGYAVDVPPPEMILDKVAFQVSAKQWVSTKTALLTVNLNATLNNADLVKARADIMERLARIAQGEWHLTRFDRSQDNSGLEKLAVEAQARVDQSSLTNVYQNAKTVSQPGASYKIAAIEFKPSLEEMQQVRAQLRERLYQQAHDELARINKVYTGQDYSLFNIMFMEGDVGLKPKMFQGREMMLNTMAMPAAIPELTTSHELTMTAVVQVASNRTQGN